MKKTIYMIMAGTVLCSCLPKEEPDFLPLPWEAVDTGGIGASQSSDAGALTDNRLRTYWQADADENGTVEVIVPCSESQVAAYTLVSSGVAEQTENGVLTDSDPVAWTVYGSDSQDGTWTEVESRSDISFIARFQKHTYTLSSPVSYSY